MTLTPHPYADLLIAIAEGKQMQLRKTNGELEDISPIGAVHLLHMGPHTLSIKPEPHQIAEPASDPIRALIAKHAELINAGNNYAYFELAYTRTTGWMAWLTDKPLTNPALANPDRQIIARGQGDTAEAACADALIEPVF